MPTPVGGFIRNRPNSLLGSSAPTVEPITSTLNNKVDPFAIVNRIMSNNQNIKSGTGPTGRLGSLQNASNSYKDRIVSNANERRVRNLQEQRSQDQSRSDFNRSLSEGTNGSNNSGYDYGSTLNNQIAGWARQGGWAEKDIPMAIAIAHAESGGNPNATHGNPGGKGVDRGVWQVNDYWQRQNPAVLANPDWGTNPVSNAKAALEAFRSGGGWSPWSTYKNGAYKNFVPTVRTVSVPVNKTVATTSGIRSLAVKNAQAVIGLPYVWGGNSLSQGVDCSGLVQQIYKQLGVNLPRTANEQSHFAAMGHRVAINQLKPGDLVAWEGNRRGMGPSFVGHIAIYAGNGQIIEAPDVGLRVRQRALRQGENVFGVALNIG